MDEQDREALVTLRKTFTDVSHYVETEFHGAWYGKFTNLYAVVYNAATRSKIEAVDQHYVAQEALYQFCQEILTDYMLNYSVSTSQPPEKLFAEVVRRWNHYKVVKRWVQLTFSYLSRYYVVHCNKPSLEVVTLTIFNERLFRQAAPQIRQVLFALIQSERSGDTVNREMVKAGIDMFSRMAYEESRALFDVEFVTPFLAATAEFYRREANGWIAADSATTYLEKAEHRLLEEERRCKRYFSQTTERQVIQQVEHELLEVHQTTLLQKEGSGFGALLRDLRLDHIKRFFELSCRLPHGLEPMAQILRDHCHGEGMVLLERYAVDNGAEIDFKGYVTDLIALQDKYSRILFEQLADNAVFQKSIRDAFETVINQGVKYSEGSAQTATRVSSCELLANYCDTLVKNSCADKKTESEMEVMFDKVVAIFAYISDKDVFQEHAKKHLSRRLLSSASTDEVEKMFISKLKGKCGAPFTSHFEGMISDKNASISHQQRFHEYLDSQKISPPFEFSCQILTMGFWPKFVVDDVILPEEVTTMMRHFSAYYAVGTQHRVLNWTNVSATATLFFVRANKELQLTAFQACVLLLFNAHQSLSTGGIVKILNIDFEEVKKIIPSFTKVKLLVRQGEAPTLQMTDTFSVNDAFTNVHRKIRIPLAVPRISVGQSTSVAVAVEEDRKPAIEACLMRIMKSRRQLDHTLLVSECMQQLSARFKPDPKMIKQRIEDLINRDYLERVPDKQPCAYRYLA